MTLQGDATNEQQVVTVVATGGTFTLTYDGQTTSAIAEAATAAAVDAALEALSNVGAGDVAVTGDDGGPFTVEFTGALAEGGASELTADGALLTGPGAAATVETTVPGRAADATASGVPMHPGHATEPQGPEDALGPGRKRGDYSERGDGSSHFSGSTAQSYGPWNDHSDEPAEKGGVSTT